MGTTLLITFLVLILLIIGSLYFGYFMVQRKMRNFTNSVFGTNDLNKIQDMMTDELANRPKSVSGMTSLLLPKINKDFPDFNYDEIKVRAENILVSYFNAIDKEDPELAKEAGNDIMWQIKSYLEGLNHNNKREHFEEPTVHKTEITSYVKSEGRCTITLQSAAGFYHYITDSTGGVVSGSKEHLYQTRYNISLFYIQDRELVENDIDGVLGLHCPNCGAPVKSLGAKNCEYCGSFVQEINIHSWTFEKIKEVH